MNTSAPALKPAYSPPRLPLPYLVNSVAISDDGSLIVAGTFYYTYYGTNEPRTQGTYGTYVLDRASGKRIWADEFVADQGVYAVAISGDGRTAAAGGLLHAQQGLLRAYDAANGALLLDYNGIARATPGGARSLRVSCVALSSDGRVLAAVADKVYVFIRSGTVFPDQPTAAITFPDAFNEASLPASVAVQADGNWLAACDKLGNVFLAPIEKSVVGRPYRWRAPLVPIDRNNPASLLGPVELLSVAAARTAPVFAAGGNDYVYLFDAGRMASDPSPAAQCDTWDHLPLPSPANGTPATVPPRNVRWVAISGDGRFVTAVVNRYRDGGRNGSLLAFRNEGGKLLPAWERLLPRNPNSASVDYFGSFVAATDGYPFGTPGAFYGFDSSGTPLWVCETTNMNWPVAVTPDGKWIAGGGDDGMVYTFPGREAVSAGVLTST